MGELSYAGADEVPRRHARIGLGGGAAPFALGALGVGGLGAAHGGYFPSSWGWSILALVAIVVWTISGRAIARLTLLEASLVSGLIALAGWYALSASWGIASTAIDEAFRALVYAIGVLATIGVVRRHSAISLLGGVLTGTTALSLYALATRLFPDRIGTFDSVAGYRLATPIGYWNALGLLCAIAVLLSIAIASSTDSPARAALAAAPVPLLLTTIYFTFSRGSWISLGIGLVVALALDPRRLRLTATALAVGVPAGIAVIVASHSAALTHQQATVARAAHDGHRLALLLLVLVVTAALLSAGCVALRDRITLPAQASRAYAIALAAAAVVAVAAVLVHFGGPTATAKRAWDSFASPPPKSQPNLQKRLFSFSGNGRADLWRAAWHDFNAHPLVGSGAGSYEAYWLAHRKVPQKVRDAHSLYLETLTELGIVGFVLLIAALGAPLVAAVRARKRPGIAAATGAYVAYLVGAGVDWDWEITSVTLAALFVGVGILAAARPDEEREMSSRMRYGVLAGAIAIGVAGFVFLIGHMFLSRASTAASAGRWTTAARDAQRASDWLPWSTQPLAQLGEAQLAQGKLKTARATFSAATRKDAGDWNLWFDLARASTGKTQATALAEAERLNPLSPEIAELKRELADQGGITVGGRG